MNDVAEKNSRFAELAMELHGARMASEFMREVWSHASEEVKGELAVAVVNAVKQQVSDGSFRWSLERLVDGALADRAKAMIETEIGKNAAALDEQIQQRLRERWDDAIAKGVRDRVEAILNEVSAKLRAR